MSPTIGIYLHIPFCKQKCAYCDFFSGKGDDAAYERYTAALAERIGERGSRAGERVESVYFGGGTPSVLGTQRLCRLLDRVRQSFALDDDAEVTLEANPESGKRLDFSALRRHGFNRLSVGLQSAVPEELAFLGRIHSPEEAALTVRLARRAGFENLSLDLMMGIPCQTGDSLRRSIDFCLDCGVKHLSCYLLKIEKGTRFDSIKEQLSLPDEDEQAQLYLSAAAYLEAHGLRQYEISNFSFPGFESRHNTRYWKCGEYIGLGPAAYSFYHGRRSHCARSLTDFYRDRIIDDGPGGDEEEFIMLALRLKTGLVFAEYAQRFGRELPGFTLQKLRRYADAGFMELDEDHACFTAKGFLVSNTILSDILPS